MAVIKVETKNNVDIDKKARVYFTCHPDDIKKHFKKICDDIFKTHDCAIYYTEDMTEVIDEDEKSVDLGRNNIFVVPVTYKLLSTPNRAMDEDIPYAFKTHIPVLPIMMEPGVEAIYAQPDKFGELQYLNPYSHDPTEISYEEKLKKYLESVLISDELAKRVRKAFDAYIFLSYRKKDRRYANELMRLIHSNSECRDIAIWFDEFLTPGESFQANIEQILDNCELFTLLITPQLLEKVVDEKGTERDNYVISTELPLARKKKQEKGTEILAVEMVDTDKEALRAIHIEEYISSKDEAFRARLLAAISRVAVTENNTPEHNFLIGLAYLDGIDVETDRDRALELITSAAESGLPEAMQRLYEMYRDGIGVALNYKIAVEWAEKHHKYMSDCYGKMHPKTLDSMYQLVLACDESGNYKKSLSLKKRLFVYQRIAGGRKSNNTLIAKSQLANAYIDSGKCKKALKVHKKIYAVICKKYGEDHPKAFNCLNDIALTYHKLGDYEKAVELQEKASLRAYDFFGEEHPETHVYLENLSIYLSDTGDFEKAYAFAKNIYALRTKIFGEEHPNTICAINTLASTVSDLGDHMKAAELQEKDYILCCRILGEEHPYTATILSNLAKYYFELCRYEEAQSSLEKVYDLNCKLFGEENPETIQTLGNLAVMQFYLKNYKESISLGQKAYSRYCKVCGKDYHRTLDTLQNLAKAYFMAGENDTAWRYYKKLYSQSIKVYGKKHRKSREVKKELDYLKK